ncbi:hypothetical protein [uncultured Pseudoxanthomonas sp.]|uniref:hypothetical protein n=1 Tax=uncultured Pseudoxanthomonas sp. TaxID=281701 RepID=UPI0026017CD1|nr:hypothetical protein [uncultured Pseudoxanthomonas sp.]
MSKVLVLGAGASVAYGYPLGSRLRQEILNLSQHDAMVAGIVRERYETLDIRELVKFQETFKHSQLYSIDAFLAKRKEFSEIGKKCIARVLLRCEGSKPLFLESSDKDHWYQYAFNQIAQREWDELTFDDLAIVTFNYDRSLEHFLYVALQSTYGKSAYEVSAKLKTLRIVHVYGALCEALPGDDGYLSYDGKIDADKIAAAASGLVVIPEGRSDSPTIVRAREWLGSARSICFLGFGFDSLNVERLSMDESCLRWKQTNQGRIIRGIYGTCIGMTKAEINAAVSSLSGASASELGDHAFQPVNCTQMLRETLFFR